MAKKPLNLPATLQEKRLLDIEEQLKSLPRPSGAWRTLERCNEKITVITKFNLNGGVGGTTELLAPISIMKAIGLNPVLINADPTSSVLKNIYGSKDEDGEHLEVQELGVGVVVVDMEDKDNKLFDYIWRIPGRDIVIDTKGGIFSALVALYQNGLDDMYSPFEYSHRFINLDSISADRRKAFENLNQQYLYYNQITVETEIHLVRIFSLGMCASISDLRSLVAEYEEWEKDHQFSNPNIHVHKLIFNAGWKLEEVKDFFATKDIRNDYIKYPGQLYQIAPMYLNERDKAWANILLDKQSIDEVALLSDPTPPVNPAIPVKQWGKKLFGSTWKPFTE